MNGTFYFEQQGEALGPRVNKSSDICWHTGIKQQFKGEVDILFSGKERDQLVIRSR